LQALERAAALYDGDLLVGVGVRESAFEDHLRSERERLRVRAAGVFGRLLEHHIQRNQVEAATATALRLLAMDPTQEAVHRALMKLFAASGRRAAALRQYQECVEILQRELDVEPEAATRQLYREILASSQSPTAPRGVTPKTDPLGAEPPLAGRKAELATLGDVLDHVCARRGHVISVVGEAGVGKTRLVAQLTALAAERDGRTIVGRAYETARVLALGPWVDALRAGLAAEPAAMEALEPAWRTELGRVLPEVESRPARRAAPADAARIFEAIDRLVARLAARQPLIVVLEDVHWADELTVRLAAYLGRRIEARAVLLVVTAREEDLTEASLLGVALKELRSHARFVPVPLSPLSRADTTALTRSMTRAERDQKAVARLDEEVWRISAGNPLLVVETVRALRHALAGGQASAALPMRVREIVTTRLERLSEPARRVVSIASIVGRECDFRLLQHCAGLNDRAAAEVVEELVRRRVFHGVDERLDFTHDRIREVAIRALVPAQTKAIHRLIATSMEELYAGDLERHCAALAAHCREGELWDRAVTHLAEAGVRAAERSAHREAAAFFEQALAALERLPESPRTLEQAVDIRLALHTSYYAVAELKRGHHALCDAEISARKLGDPRRSAQLALQTGQSLWVSGRAGEALPLFEQAAATVRALSPASRSGDATVPERWAHDPIKVFAKTLDDFALLTSTTLYIGAARFALGEFAVAEESFRHVIAALGEAAAGQRLGLHGLPLVFAESGLTALMTEQGRFEEARAHGTASVRIAETLNHSYTLVFAIRIVGYAYTMEGRLPEAIAVLERGRALCEGTGLLALEPNILTSLGYAYSIAGRAREGVPLIERGLAVLEDYGQRVWYVSTLNQLSESWLLAGDVGRARECAQRALSIARERGERGFEAGALRMLGAVALSGASPDPVAAREHYGVALELADKRGMQPIIAHCHSGLAVVHTLLGDAGTAETHRAHARRICQTIGMTPPPALTSA
jgi:tetratricopeptide (TPR) repeat protein